MTLKNPPLFPQNLRNDLEQLCSSKDVTRICNDHTKSGGSKLLDKYFEARLMSKDYSIKRDGLLVAQNCKFDLDLLITGPNWKAAVLIEGGKAARIDLDLMKLIAWCNNIKKPLSAYGILIVSDKKLHRNITGTPGESAFDYLRRLRPLFLGTGPKLTDLLMLEFNTTK